MQWYLEWDWVGAEQHYRRALTLNPESALTHAQFGIFLAAQSRSREALSEVTKGIALDPLSLIVGFYCAATHYALRRYAEALQECGRILELDPNFTLALWIRTLTLSELQRHDEAIETAERALAVSNRQPFYLSALGVAWARAGRRDDANRMLQELRALAENVYVLPLHFADLYIALGMYDEGCEWMARACDDRNGFVTFIAMTAPHDGIRSDPRFADLITRMGLENGPVIEGVVVAVISGGAAAPPPVCWRTCPGRLASPHHRQSGGKSPIPFGAPLRSIDPTRRA